MAVDAKDYVKDIEKKDNLKQELRDRIDDEKFVQKLDQDVEKSFQQFTESIKSNLTGSETREELQDRFNGRLDRQMANLDSFRNNEIARDIIGPTTFELQNFSTATELGIFQSQLIEQNDATQHTKIISVKSDDLKFKDIRDSKGELVVDKNKIAELFNKNFKGRDYLLNLLKKGGPNDIKKFQRIIAEINENDKSKDHTPETNAKLGDTGVDGMFGGRTLEAFEQYVQENSNVDNEAKNSAPVNQNEDKEPIPNEGQGQNNGAVDDVDLKGNANNSTEKPSEGGETVPEGYVLLSSLNLSPKEIEKIKDEKLADFGRWILDLLGRGKVEEPTKQEIAKRMEGLFGPGGIIFYKSKGKTNIIPVKELYDKIKDGTLDVAWDRVQVEGTVSKYASIFELEGTEMSPAICLGTVTISEKTENTLSGNEGTITNGTQLEADTGNMLDLSGITSVDFLRAVERANHEGSINLTGLKKLNTDVLHAFMNGKCKSVYFPGGIMIKDDGDPYILIDGEKNTEINKEICKKLLEKKLSGIEVNNGNNVGHVDGSTDVQQQYEGVGYNIDNPEVARQASTDEEAIQFLTKGSGAGVFFIARLFGKKKHNAELSIVGANYEPIKQEKTDLNDLNKYLLECKDNPTEVFTKIFGKNKDFGDNENLGKLYDLYRECRKDQNGTKKGAYLKKVMGLLENYFVRGIKGKDGKVITTFKDMYNNELLGLKKDLEKKDKKATKKLSEDEKVQLEESGGTASEAVNTKTQLALPSENFAEFKEKYGFDSDAETQFAMCLCDLNADGRIDSRDMNAKTGQELFNMIRDAKVDQKYGILEKGPMYNILNFAKIKAEQDGHTNTAEFLKGIDLGGADEEIMNKIKERPLTVQYLRYMLINSPMNMANNIIRYGGVKIETENTGDDLNLDKETREAINKIMSDEKFEEIYGNAYKQLIEQGLNDTPEIEKKLRPIIALALLESYGEYGVGVAGGFDRSLGKAGDLAFILGATYGADGKPTIGISATYGKSVKIEGDNFFTGDRASVGASLGFNVAEGQFIPIALLGAGYDKMINRENLQNTLNARSSKYIGVDANVGYAGTVVRGVGLSYSQDKLEGITMTYESIKGKIGDTLKDALKEKRPDATDKTEIRTQMTESIKKALGEKFGKTNKKELEQAAKNIFGGISYYLTDVENPSKITEKQKTAIIEKVAENYATQRRNKEMQTLDGKTTFERVRVGIEFFNGFWPVPMASVSLKTYGNLTADETVESMENYYQRLSSGIGMDYIDNSVSTEGNDKGYLKQEFFKYKDDKKVEHNGYLNDKLAVLSPNGDVPLIEKIINEKDSQKYDLSIPRTLCKYVNICYSPDLEGIINFEESDDTFRVPANIKVGLLTYSRSRDGKYNLILGDFKKGDGFKDLDINSKPEGDTTKYEGKEGELQITESTINDNEEMQKLFETPEFPLSKCVDSKDGKVYFKEKEGSNILIDKSLEESGILGFSQGGILSVPEFGMLQITKAKNNKNNIYIATFDDSIKDKLTIKYVDREKVDEYIANSKREVELKDTLDQYTQLNDMFKNIEQRLSKLDDGRWGAYVNFMNHASTMIDNVLNESSYERAFTELKNMLRALSSDDLENTDLKALKDLIDKGNLSNVEKTLIVDKFKMLFSYDINLTDGKNDYDDLCKTINGGQGGKYGRGNVYETLKGYNGETIPESLHGYRDKILDKLKGQEKLEKQPWPYLIGMTAFYRYNENSSRRIKEGRGYSMTEIGGTTVLGGAYEELNDNSEATNRFIDNLKTSNPHKAILSEVITKKIHSIEGLENVTITGDQVISLLEGNKLDISEKKLTIAIDMTYMFYLLGECGNESIGVNLEKIIIKGIGGGGNVEIGTTTVEIGPETSYKNSAGLGIDGVNSENNLNIGNEKSRTYGVYMRNDKTGHTHDDTGVENIHKDSTGEQNIVGLTGVSSVGDNNE